MESGAVAAQALGAGVPFLAVRVIADPASASIPMSALAIVDEFGRLRVFKLIEVLGRDPTAVPALIRQGRYFHAAQRTLRRIVRLAGNKFLIPE
jgi:adenosylhomocysteine nucleosidase